MAEKDDTRWSYAAGLDEMCSPGCYLLQLRHNCPGTTLPLPACYEEHYITATLIVTESGTDEQLQRNRMIGQTLIMPDCNDGRTRIFNRTLKKGNSNRAWNNWNNIAQSSMDDEITSTEDLIASVTELKSQTKEIKTDLSSETARSKEAEAGITEDAILSGSLNINPDKERITLAYRNIDGTEVSAVDIPAASTEKAGVMSAEDKVKADSSFDYVNSIEDKQFDVSSLSVGNANTRDVGTTVSFGKLEDWRVGTFRCKAGQLIKINTQGGIGATRPFAFCDRDLVILQSFGYDVGDGINKGAYVAPEGTEYIVVNCTADYADKFLLEVWGKQNVPSSIDDRSYTASFLWVGNATTRDVGTTVSFGKLEDWRVGTFRCKAGQLIKIDTQGGIGGARPFAFCDKDLTILQTSGKDTGDGMLNGEFIAPEGTEYIVVNCTDEYAGSFSLEIMGSIVYEMQNMDVAPQIYEQPIRRRGKDESVRLCFFGNSWHMNTWWYLNKMLHSAGINAEMKCFYIGGSIFNKWVDNYKNNTAVDCWISVNGSNWEHDTLNFADTLKEKWDVIAFQQGAYKALDWNNWSIYNELTSIIKRNCEVDTVIAFNVGWTPALQNENLAVYGNTVEGQRIWQEIDNRYTLRFMKMSGISNVAPNGATMWSMRRNPKLNVANDMATDALHPDNGLPMYGLAGTWWQTYIAPMFGVDFSEVEWMPTESSQKAEWVSGTTWQPISEEQRELIREIVKLSMSDRFGFNEV